jgi:hypothetical protein
MQAHTKRRQLRFCIQLHTAGTTRIISSALPEETSAAGSIGKNPIGSITAATSYKGHALKKAPARVDPPIEPSNVLWSA